MIGFVVRLSIEARLGLIDCAFLAMASSYRFFLTPEVAVSVFEVLGLADPHLLLSGEVKLQAC